MTLILAILNALVAIPKIAGYIESLAAAITQWYVARQTAQTLSMISDAAALAAKAQTTEDRYAAAQAWQAALSRGRVTPN